MKKVLANRLVLLISHLGIKKIDFAQRINFSQSYTSMVLNGIKTNPSSRFYDAVCREFSINPEWLKSGKGEMFAIPGLSASSIDAEILAKLRLLPSSEQKMIEGVINTLLMKTMTEQEEKTSHRGHKGSQSTQRKK